MSEDHDLDDAVSADINMTPLIDIMLVLLIIFMMTSSIGLESGLDIDLPQVASATSPKEGTSVLLSLDRQGNIAVQGKATDLNNLESAIKEALAQNNTQTVVLEGDHQSTFGLAVRVMDYAKAAGATKFAIAAELEAKK
ncbi:MAG: biopolymer transporter ExbD [Bacteriovoracaceae bacterium]|nr:biopolymer transporter ExbD [Bacteriovoracaceae bacterium]